MSDIMENMLRREEDLPFNGGFDAGGYSLYYKTAARGAFGMSMQSDLRLLFDRYGDLLWEPGTHKLSVTSFIYELHDLLEVRAFTAFTQDMLDELIGKLRKRGNGNATINRKMAALSKLLRKAFKMGDITALPEFQRHKEKAGRIRFLGPDEERRLFEAISRRSELYGRFCAFLVDTGARRSEGLNLLWTDITNDRVTFWITKSGRSRSVPLTLRAKEAANASDRRKPGPFVDIDRQSFRRAWIAAKKEIGLGDDPDVVPHVLRHTCASRLVQGGIDIRRVQTWLGHQTLQMTMRYAHLASHDLDVCVPVLEKAIIKTTVG